MWSAKYTTLDAVLAARFNSYRDDALYWITDGLRFSLPVTISSFKLKCPSSKIFENESGTYIPCHFCFLYTTNFTHPLTHLVLLIYWLPQNPFSILWTRLMYLKRLCNLKFVCIQSVIGLTISLVNYVIEEFKSLPNHPLWCLFSFPVDY